ncbi:MAG TPA: hypothetical protein VMR17_23845 [Xanthobacteraceae bacterium]|nr:hypothetical protein [Xanthobacteraceae bacterium]
MAGWAELTAELECWRDAGAAATFWWRDDDAVDDTPQLDVLLKQAGTIPLALAVIPGLASRDLAAKLAKHGSVVVLQHGWRHANHAPGGNNEYPASRPMADVSKELADGRQVLTSLFGPQAIPVFAPPWHGFDACFLPLLQRNGLAGISRRGPRPSLFAAEDLVQANVHVSLIKWSIPPSFDNVDVYLDQIIDHLRGRRLGRYDAAEPTGVLTHHLAQNDESYAFISQFVAIVSEHPAAVWTDPKILFAPPAAEH